MQFLLNKLSVFKLQVFKQEVNFWYFKTAWSRTWKQLLSSSVPSFFLDL